MNVRTHLTAPGDGTLPAPEPVRRPLWVLRVSNGKNAESLFSSSHYPTIERVRDHFLERGYWARLVRR